MNCISKVRTFFGGDFGGINTLAREIYSSTKGVEDWLSEPRIKVKGEELEGPRWDKSLVPSRRL